MSGTTAVTRRLFLKVSGTAAGGLVLAFCIPSRENGGRVAPGAVFTPNAFVRIGDDGSVTVMVNKSEMGQGVYTSLPMLIAEELDADWTQIRVESAPAEPAYNHTFFGMYLTGGSTSIASSWQQFRNAGATARAMLVKAAARKWEVAEGELSTENGTVVHASGGRRATYGELVAIASELPVPEQVPLKEPGSFRLIGTNVKRVEGPAKVRGEARFGLDVRQPGMLTAVVARPPVLGGKVKSLDAGPAQAVPGVLKVKPLSSGVAVLATDFWTAIRGREALRIEWDEGPNAGLSSIAIRNEFLRLLDQPGMEAEVHGDADAALAAARRLEAVYEVPYLAHAPMEPPNCTAQVHADGCDIWTGTQFQTNDQRVAAQILGLKPEQIRIHTELLGGGFGRRANPSSDFVADAVEAARGEGVPVKVVWTREEDIQCGYFRPLFVHKLSAGLDRQGMPVAWKQRIAGQSIFASAGMDAFIQNGIDPASVEGAVEMPYAIPNRRIELHTTRAPVQILWWRSVGHTHTGFANECFLDELAHAGGHDPFEYRRRLLVDRPRELKVLELAAEKAGWGQSLPAGRARGIAMRKSFESFVAQVAEVSLSSEGTPRVHRVVAAIDCGIAVNPWNVQAQVEGAIAYGLTAALHGEITIEKGRVQQSNFHDYEMLRMQDLPEIEVHIVESSEPPTGVGEPGVPPIAPALANALFALTGKRVRKLPIRL